jgi:transposase-like protein
MPIKFACPHCKRGLSVKDHLAGKRAACPACKKALTIPRGSSTNHPALRDIPAAAPPAPHVDAESAAAEAFADEPAAASREIKTVDFTCPFCDAELKLDVEVAGKRTSCPECRRIIKVPEVEQEGPKDWRKAARTGPSGAKGQDLPEPEGAWGSAKAEHVSRDALLEADVLPDRRKISLTTRQKIRRGIGYGAVGACALIAAIIIFRWAMSSSEQRALNGVIAFADSDDAKAKVGREAVAVLDVAAGEYYLQTKRDGSAIEAKKQFEKALKQLNSGAAGPGGEDDREGVLIDLAVASTDLAGTKEQASDGQHLDDKESQKLLRAVLEAMHRPESRLEALRLAGRRLVAAHQAQRALALASQVGDPAEQSEALATVGLELYAAGETDLAGRAADQALAPFKTPESQKPPPTSVALVALATLLNRQPPRGDDEVMQAGSVEALARQGKFDKARQQAAALDDGSGRLRAFLAATGETTPDKQAATEAIAAVPALRGAERARLAWTLLHLVRLGAEAGVEEGSLRQAADAIPELALRARGHLLILRGRLARNKDAVADDALATIDAKTASHYRARAELARHNTLAGNNYAKTVQSWDEQYRPFGVIGTMLK